MLVVLVAASAAHAFETAAKAAIIIDFRTGAVLFEKNADERVPPASMSKLMTAYMVFDRLKSGRLKLDEEVLVSERAWKMGGSQMFLKVGDQVKVEDLIRGSHHPVRQRCLRDARRGHRRLRGGVRRADEREGAGDSA